MKIAIVGAGSIGFTRRLVRDLLSVPELADARLAFQDISQDNLDKVTTLCRRDIAANGVPATIDAGTEREPALDGADYVINTARVGGLAGFRADVEIPLRYGSRRAPWPSSRQLVLAASWLCVSSSTVPRGRRFCTQPVALAPWH